MKGRVPGEPGIWILVFGDLGVFGLFFGTFAYYNLLDPEMFQASQRSLDQGLGLLNTFLLLTSSLFVVKTLEVAKHGVESDRAQRWALAAIAMGVGFVAVKAVEYHDKLAGGIYPVTNNFYMLYYAFTGIHLVHVLIGIGALGFMRSRLKDLSAPSRLAIVEGCAIFWHLVDILWVILFAIFYLHR